jgi:hypothetical protein
MNATPDISIRSANPDDYTALWQLAALDDRALPRGPFVVADVGGEVIAAVSRDTGEAIADPFRRTAQAVALLQLRVDQLRAVAA